MPREIHAVGTSRCAFVGSSPGYTPEKPTFSKSRVRRLTVIRRAEPCQRRTMHTPGQSSRLHAMPHSSRRPPSRLALGADRRGRDRLPSSTANYDGLLVAKHHPNAAPPGLFDIRTCTTQSPSPSQSLRSSWLNPSTAPPVSRRGRRGEPGDVRLRASRG
jgi:hypothetical protein